MSTAPTGSPSTTTTMTRRRAVVWSARAGAAVAVGAWAVPRFETIAGATGTGTGTGTGTSPTTGVNTTGPNTTDPPVTTAGTGTGTAGSPCPDPDAPACQEETTTTRPGAGRRVSCRVSPEEVRPGGKAEFSGEGWESSSVVAIKIVGHGRIGEASVQPNGTFARRLTIPDLPEGNYRVEVVGSDAEGHEAHCFDDMTVSKQGSVGTGTDPGTDPGSGNSGSGGSDNSGNGTLPFTGSDSTNLLALGAGALVVGRLLYGVRERLAERDGAVAES